MQKVLVNQMHSFVIKDDEIWKNTIKSGIETAVVFKKNLIVNQCAMKNI